MPEFRAVQNETNMAADSMMTCKIDLISRHIKTLFCFCPNYDAVLIPPTGYVTAFFVHVQSRVKYF